MEGSKTSADSAGELPSRSHEALDEVIGLAYRELRAIAHRRLRAGEQRGTLSTTALVHETYLKLVEQSKGGWRDYAHFLAVASLAMRHVLVDRARERIALKRGGVRRRITLDEADLSAEDQPEAVLQINDALEHISTAEPRLVQVVECRFFGGLTEQETADALGLSVRSVQRDWVKARVLLRRVLAA